MSEISISIISSPEFCVALSELLVEVVANSGCVSFMHPLPPPVAIKFWESSLAAAARGERIVFGAWHATNLIGTVMMPLDCPPHQPHRAEIAKLMRRIDHRAISARCGYSISRSKKVHRYCMSGWVASTPERFRPTH